jgi:hypothetical protein
MLASPVNVQVEFIPSSLTTMFDPKSAFQVQIFITHMKDTLTF